MKKRLFLAIDLPDAYIEAFAAFISDHRGRFGAAKWVRPENLHLTVCFLGGVEAAKVGEAISAARSALAAQRPFSLEFDGLRFAPPGRPPTMIWATFGRSGDYDGLAGALGRAMKPFAEGAGREKEAIPHVTLVRFKGRVEPIELAQPPGLPPLIVSSCALYESDLLPDGPHYAELARFEFPPLP